MTEPQEGFLVVRKYGARLPMSAEIYSVSLNPEPPPPDPVHEARKATASMVIPASIHALDQLDDPVSRAVLDLHRRTAYYDRSTTWECDACPGDEYRTDWPCATVEAVAGVHGIDLTDDFLFSRPADGSLDLPTPEDR